MIQDSTRLIQRNVVKIGEEKSTSCLLEDINLKKKISTSLKGTNFKPIAMPCIPKATNLCNH